MNALAAIFELLLFSRRHGHGCPVVFGTPERRHDARLCEFRILGSVKWLEDNSEKNQVRSFNTSLFTSQLEHVKSDWLFWKKRGQKAMSLCVLIFGKSRKVCSMKERGQSKRVAIYVQLFSVSRPAKEGHSPIMYMLQSFNLCSQKHAFSDSRSCSKCFFNIRSN